jgi:nucleotide-binding universal stress UspA family protein
MERFKNILCVVDAGSPSDPVLDRACDLALNNQAELTVVDVVEGDIARVGVPDGGPITGDLGAVLVNRHRELLEAQIERYRSKVQIQAKVLLGTPFLEVIREVLRNGHDLVLKQPESWDWLDRLLGSDDMHLLRKCPCPVWIIKPREEQTCQRIMAAVDVDENYPPAERDSRRALNRQVLKIAGSLALSEFAELHIVHAWQAVGEGTMRGAFLHVPDEKVNAYVEQVRRQRETSLNGLVEQMVSELGDQAVEYLKPQVQLIKGWARKEIPQLAGRMEADLVVMGTVARTGVPGFIMGNTAEAILSQIQCSVLAIKPPGFVTPVSV